MKVLDMNLIYDVMRMLCINITFPLSLPPLQIEISPNTTGGVQMSPDSTVKCYDGDSEHDTLIAVYRYDITMLTSEISFSLILLQQLHSN